MSIGAFKFLVVIAKPPNADSGADAIQEPLAQCLELWIATALRASR